MKMQINFNTQYTKPTFKAQFSKDPETKSALKQCSEASPMLFYSLVDLVEKSPTNDRIAFRKDEDDIFYKVVNLDINESPDVRAYHDELYSLVNYVKLSNNQSMNTYAKKLLDKETGYKYKNSDLESSDHLSHLIKKFQKTSGSVKLMKEAHNIEKKIAKLKEEQAQLYRNINIIEANYAKDLYEKKFGNK